MNTLAEVIAFLESFKPVHHQAEEDVQSALLFLRDVKEWEDLPSDQTLCDECREAIPTNSFNCPRCGDDRTR